MHVEWGGYVNKEVCVNIELFLLVFVHEKSRVVHSQLANECLMVSYGFCQVSYRCGLLKVGKFVRHPQVHTIHSGMLWTD